MKQNIGTLNALVRITCGLTMLAWSTAELTDFRKNSGRQLFIAAMGAMKVAEGITRFCPLTKMVTDSVSNTANKESQEDPSMNEL
ncbi:Protein of unknown function [Alteribacillus persepolensis]|uniref:Inner membrane protein YgaP-like transmembrane domain-containing protein n=1 Tax=Alteribacillus persepolensis TaxID=568899 RepID=A0A1G8F5V2_9BACI|nr:DUF2892 domain-containing protein [Alteribacillus persepolensis]SDH77491.1 Protein of unknown function [Alteribacillus persepolensis]